MAGELWQFEGLRSVCGFSNSWCTVRCVRKSFRFSWKLLSKQDTFGAINQSSGMGIGNFIQHLMWLDPVVDDTFIGSATAVQETKTIGLSGKCNIPYRVEALLLLQLRAPGSGRSSKNEGGKVILALPCAFLRLPDTSRRVASCCSLVDVSGYIVMSLKHRRDVSLP